MERKVDEIVVKEKKGEGSGEIRERRDSEREETDCDKT